MLDIEKLKKQHATDRPLDERSKKAKMDVLKQIADMASDHMGSDLKGMQKVTVASPDTEGLKMGLDQAKDVVQSHEKTMLPSDHGSSMGGDDHDLQEGNEPDESEGDDDSSDMGPGHSAPSAEENLENQIEHESAEGDLSDDEIDELIKDLESKKASRSKK